MRCSCTGGILLTCILGLALTSRAQEQKPASQKHRYTIAEYNAYENAVKQAEPEKQVQLLDEFVSKYPASALLALVYSQYSKAYGEMKNFGKVIEFTTKLIAMGDEVSIA